MPRFHFPGNRLGIVFSLFTLIGVSCSVSALRAAETATTRDATKDREAPGDETDAPKPAARPSLPEPAGAQRLSPRYPIWLDTKEKAVLVDGQICLREGMLEMFSCTRNTKEHESIVSADTKAYLVHAGLLSLGAQVGHPVQFQP
ncbi:MAG TPA: YdjY domain-containing protein, partial [Lacipirellulaceae bacterium]|nr:YdjY domain-containing protein [Lacipirellulaceae bacterium]